MFKASRNLLPIAAGAALAFVVFAGAPASAQDAAAGARTFAASCGVCHTATSGGANRIGPNLFGVVGRPAASLQGFNYSQAMRNSGITWSSHELLEFVQGPMREVPGTRMTYAGIRDPQQAANVVAYLETLH